jgi:hypothetical protein
MNSCNSKYVPVYNEKCAPFTICYGSNYTTYKKNRLLYQEYLNTNKTTYKSYALKQGIQHACNYKYYLNQCTVKNSNRWVLK